MKENINFVFTPKFIELYDLWEQGKITNKDFLEKSGLKPATFFYMAAEYRQYKKSEIELVIEEVEDVLNNKRISE